jgi:hypothetical protein
MTPDIEVVIDELVLYGLARSDRHRIGQAIQNELTNLLSGSRGLSSSARSQELAHVIAETVHLPEAAQPSVVGMHVAQAIYRGIGQ